jgi:hypothetical protein
VEDGVPGLMMCKATAVAETGYETVDGFLGPHELFRWQR